MLAFWMKNRKLFTYSINSNGIVSNGRHVGNQSQKSEWSNYSTFVLDDQGLISMTYKVWRKIGVKFEFLIPTNNVNWIIIL